MPTAPLPNEGGGRPLPLPAAIAPAGLNAPSRAPPPMTAPPARPAFLRKPRRVSPLSSASAASCAVSRTAPSPSTRSREISGFMTAPFYEGGGHGCGGRARTDQTLPEDLGRASFAAGSNANIRSPSKTGERDAQIRRI